MANHKSALKRNRQNIKKREQNSQVKAEVRTYVKSTRTAAAAGEVDKAKEEFDKAQKAITIAAGHGIFHRKNASRKISRLALAVNKAAQSS